MPSCTSGPPPLASKAGIHERLHALNWLTTRFEENWDDVSTDT